MKTILISLGRRTHLLFGEYLMSTGHVSTNISWLDDANLSKLVQAGGPYIVKYVCEDSKRTAEYYVEYNENRAVHASTDAPAVTFSTSRIKASRWYKDGKLHNTSGPAIILNWTHGQPSKDDYYWAINGNEFKDFAEWATHVVATNELSKEDILLLKIKFGGI